MSTETETKPDETKRDETQQGTGQPSLVSREEALRIRTQEARPRIETAGERERRRIEEFCRTAPQRLRDQMQAQAKELEKSKIIRYH